MNKNLHLREKAVELRKKGYSLPAICDRLKKSKTTVYYWIKDIEIEKINIRIKSCRKNTKEHALRGGLANQRKYKKIHDEHKKIAAQEWEEKYKDNDEFKLFLMLYLTEGYRKGRFGLSLANSNPTLIVFAKKWFDILNIRKKNMRYSIQIHVDQDETKVKNYWKDLLGASEIKVSRKSNSGKLGHRYWASEYAVLTLEFFDAYVKTMLDYWMEQFQLELNGV